MGDECRDYQLTWHEYKIGILNRGHGIEYYILLEVKHERLKNITIYEKETGPRYRKQSRDQVTGSHWEIGSVYRDPMLTDQEAVVISLRLLADCVSRAHFLPPFLMKNQCHLCLPFHYQKLFHNGCMCN